MTLRTEPFPVLTAEEMQRWDRRAVDVLDVPEPVLIEAAGRAAARALHHAYPEGRVVAAVGKGNNGADAVVALRCLMSWGRDVVAVPVGRAELPAGLAHGWSIPVGDADDFARAAVVVDGILGTGATGAPRGAAGEAVERINAAGAPVVALDGPTGVDLTTGQAPGPAVRAALTVTFGALKRGLLLFPGRAHAGRVVVVEVGFPPLEAGEAAAGLVTREWASARLPVVAANAHKGTLGTVALVAGSAAMGGAALLGAHGALRAGAGKARVVSTPELRTALQAALPEALFVDRSAPGVVDALDGSDAIVAGPGMGTDDAALALLREVLGRTDTPRLLDADALTLLARHPGLLPDAGRERLLLTPHPGELSRLLGRPTGELLEDVFGAAQEAVERFGCTVLAKGAPALVAAPGEPVLVNVTGHSGIATGGMGDTLAGVAGALLAAGASPRAAAALALYYSGRAAEIAGRGRSLLPRDVAEALPQALADDGAREPRDPEVLLELPRAR